MSSTQRKTVKESQGWIQWGHNVPVQEQLPASHLSQKEKNSTQQWLLLSSGVQGCSLWMSLCSLAHKPIHTCIQPSKTFFSCEGRQWLRAFLLLWRLTQGHKIERQTHRCQETLSHNAFLINSLPTCKFSSGVCKVNCEMYKTKQERQRQTRHKTRHGWRMLLWITAPVNTDKDDKVYI